MEVGYLVGAIGVAFGFVAMGFMGFAVYSARGAEDFAARCHTRMNKLMEKFDRLRLDTRVLDGIRADLNDLNNEVFGEGRTGKYPDMGLREWARVWRGRLRDDVADLQTCSPTVSQLDIESLDKRIDVVSDLRYQTGEDLQAGKKAHNDLAMAMGALVEHLGLVYTTENVFVKRSKR